MSVHTILSQEIKEFREKFVKKTFRRNNEITVWWKVPYKNGDPEIASPVEVEEWIKSFATRIVEEVGKELQNEWKIQSSEFFWGRFDEYKLITEFSQKLMQRVLQTIEQRTKLQKMKG